MYAEFNILFHIKSRKEEPSNKALIFKMQDNKQMEGNQDFFYKYNKIELKFRKLDIMR